MSSIFFERVKILKSNKLLLITLISLVIIGSIILVNYLSFSDIEEVIINQLKENQLIKTEHIASQTENHILQVKDELITLSKFPVMETFDITKCNDNMKLVHEKIEGKIDSLIRVDKAGNVVECSSPSFSDYLGMNIQNKDYFKIPKETSEPFIAGSVNQGSNLQIIVSAPLFETTKYTPYPNFVGEFKGTLLSIVELNKLYDLYFHPIIRTGENYFLLIDMSSKETILKSSQLEDYSELENNYNNLLKKGGLDTISHFEGFGETIITSSDIYLGSETWRLILLTPLDNVGKEIRIMQRRHLFSLGFVIVVITTIFFFIFSLYKSKEKVQMELDKTNVTLEKLGINIGTEEDKYTLADISLDAGKVYLVKEDDENHAHELFISSLNRGFAGLGVVREDPRAIKKRYNLHKTSFVWLTYTRVEGIPCENNIENLSKLISEFVKKSEKSVILLDRLDYLLTENQFEDILKNIHALKDLATQHDCIIILSVNPELIQESHLKAIEAETIDLYGKHLKKKVELSELELNILKYINENNVINKLVSYKDITINFKITKPTTRVKISNLQNIGLLQVEQKGRFKSIKITSSGRRIIS
jgi:hypothetical protein|tara:strand:+ start:27727 stop:29499 length:1773 start_codon:yes stop_codon:yes gene_type:complete